MKVTIMGLGYIGLPTSIMFAKHDVKVVGVDIKQSTVNHLNSGKVHIEEPGLQEALDEVIESGNFKASLSPEESDAFIISVPTPNYDDEYKSCDLTYVINAVNTILPYVKKGNVIIVESTIGPRSMDDVIKPIVENSGLVVGQDIYLVHCPERVLPGQIMDELINNNRIVGGITASCAEAGARVYQTFVKGEIIKTNAKTAEMSKLMENTYRDVNIALANELTKVCNKLDINVLDVIDMANKHPRVNIHTPGPGVGGHCLAVDPYFIIAKAPEDAQLMHLSRGINTSMPYYIVDRVNQLMNMVDGKKITVFGLTYKGNVDDIRESPAIKIYDLLLEQGRYEVIAYDPHVSLDWVESDLETAINHSDLILILSDHNEFKSFENVDLAPMSHKIIFDTKDVVQRVSNGIEYINYGNLPQALKKEASLL